MMDHMMPCECHMIYAQTVGHSRSASLASSCTSLSAGVRATWKNTLEVKTTMECNVTMAMSLTRCKRHYHFLGG